MSSLKMRLARAHQIRRAEWAAKAVEDHGIDLKRKKGREQEKNILQFPMSILQHNAHVLAFRQRQAAAIIEPVRRVSIDKIQRAVCAHYGIAVEDMNGPRRIKTFIEPRKLAMYLCRILTPRSLNEIGRSFGDRDHTTVLNSFVKTHRRIAVDPEFADRVALLAEGLKS